MPNQIKEVVCQAAPQPFGMPRVTAFQKAIDLAILLHALKDKAHCHIVSLQTGRLEHVFGLLRFERSIAHKIIDRFDGLLIVFRLAQLFCRADTVCCDLVKTVDEGDLGQSFFVMICSHGVPP